MLAFVICLLFVFWDGIIKANTCDFMRKVQNVCRGNMRLAFTVLCLVEFALLSHYFISFSLEKRIQVHHRQRWKRIIGNKCLQCIFLSLAVSLSFAVSNLATPCGIHTTTIKKQTLALQFFVLSLSLYLWWKDKECIKHGHTWKMVQTIQKTDCYFRNNFGCKNSVRPIRVLFLYGWTSQVVFAFA